MQSAFAKFAKNDYAKYPFLKAATKYMKTPDLRIEDLTDPLFEGILNRAKERLQDAILTTIVGRNLQNEDIEIMSFPVAIMLAAATGSTFIQKRYALAEAKQTFENLKTEPTGRIVIFTHDFEWKLATNVSAAIPYDFSLSFSDYLRDTKHLRESKWKLVNRILNNGTVYLTKEEVARLLQEEVRRHIEKRFETKEMPKFPSKIIEIAEELKKLSKERIGEAEMEGFPKTIEQEAFPPCIQALYKEASAGRHLSHVGRFALTAFLINIGMSSEKVIDLFRSFSDFNERMTRYQVEHIAGEKGSRTLYKPQNCDTLQTHSVCINPNDLCERIWTPLMYYKRKTLGKSY